MKILKWLKIAFGSMYPKSICRNWDAVEIRDLRKALLEVDNYWQAKVEKLREIFNEGWHGSKNDYLELVDEIFGKSEKEPINK